MENDHADPRPGDRRARDLPARGRRRGDLPGFGRDRVGGSRTVCGDACARRRTAAPGRGGVLHLAHRDGLVGPKRAGRRGGRGSGGVRPTRALAARTRRAPALTGRGPSPSGTSRTARGRDLAPLAIGRPVLLGWPSRSDHDAPYPFDEAQDRPVPLGEGQGTGTLALDWLPWGLTEDEACVPLSHKGRGARGEGRGARYTPPASPVEHDRRPSHRSFAGRSLR